MSITLKIRGLDPVYEYRRLTTGRRKPLCLAALAGAFLCMLIGLQSTHTALDNEALAASQMMAAEHPVAFMSDAEKKRHAAELSYLLEGQPGLVENLIGQEVRMVLKAPELDRKDGGLEIWQYRSDLCVLDVYMLEHEGGFAPVAHYEMRPRKTARFQDAAHHADETLDAAACMKSILMSREQEEPDQDTVIARR